MMFPNLRVSGLSDAEAELFSEAMAEQRDRRAKNLLLSTYYEAKRPFKDLGISIPPGLESIGATLGWPSRAVGALARKHQLEGFSLGGDVDPFGVNEVLDANDFELEFMQGVTSAYKHSCAFLLVTRGDTSQGEPPAVVSARGAETVGALWDSRRRQMKAAVVVLDTDEAGQPNEVYFLTRDRSRLLSLNRGEWLVEGEWLNPAGVDRPMIEPLRHDPQLDRPFGRSRISREVRYLTDAAIRALVRAEVSAEFFTSPQRYVLGADEEAFADKDRWSAIKGRILALGTNEEGDKPTVGQFPSQAPDQLWSTYRQLAQNFASATGLPQSQVGIFADNPASAEAMQTAEAGLSEDAEYQWRVFRPALLRTLGSVVAVSGQQVPSDLHRVQVNWTPARYVSPQAASDWAVKAVQADPTLQGTAVIRRRLGLSEGEVEEVTSAERRAAAPGILAQLSSTAQQAEDDAEVVTEGADEG